MSHQGYFFLLLCYCCCWVYLYWYIIDISTVLLKDILIYHTDVSRKTLLMIHFHLELYIYWYINCRLIFQKYRLQGAVWTALAEGDGVGILHKFLIFGISNRVWIIASHFAKCEVNSSSWDCTV